MKYLFFLLICAMSLNIQAQKSFDKLFKSYKNEENVMALELTGDMLTFLIKDNNQNEDIKNVKLLIFKDGYGLKESEKQALLDDLKNSELEELASIRSYDSNINVFVKDEGDYIKKLIVVFESDGNEIVAELNGNIHYDRLKELDFNIDGMDGLKKLGRKTR